MLPLFRLRRTLPGNPQICAISFKFSMTHGLLVRVREEVDWRFEIGRMTRESRTPLLFENVKGYPGQRVFTNGLCDTTSIGLALGLELGTSRARLS